MNTIEADVILTRRLADDVLASLDARAVKPVELAVLAAEVRRLRAERERSLIGNHSASKWTRYAKALENSEQQERERAEWAVARIDAMTKLLRLRDETIKQMTADRLRIENAVAAITATVVREVLEINPVLLKDAEAGGPAQ